MRLRLLLTTALALSPALIAASAPLRAEVTEAGIELAALQTEIAQLESRANDFMVAAVYECPPPNPIQIELQALARLSAKHAELKQRFDAARTEAIAKTHAGSSGNLAAGDIPDHGNAKWDTSSQSAQNRYWLSYRTPLDRIGKTLKDKEAALRRARVIPCPGTTPKEEIVVQPPLPPAPPPVTEPPPPPPPARERVWAPLDGFMKPTFEAADIPVVPDFFCSEAEKQAMLARIPPAQAKAQSEADAFEAYARRVEARKAELTAQGLPDHWQRSLDYEAAQARRMRDDRLTVISFGETVKKMILDTPVKDCSPKAKDGLKVGWDFKAGAEYGLGDLKLPETGYLGVENPATNERFNGIIRSAGEFGGVRKAGAHVELPVDWAPPNIFAPFGGRWSETRLRAEIKRTSGNVTQWGDFDPSGDTLFIPGLTDNIADTFTLPSTFNATVRDNLVDGFRYRGEFRQSEFSFGLAEDFKFPNCDDFTLTKTFGLRQSWSDRDDSFRADVLDYFPFAAPGFNVFADYHSRLESSTTALKLGLDGTYAPKSWNGFYAKAGIDGWVGYTDTDGAAARRLDINGAQSEQGAEFSKSDTTLGFGLRGGVGYDFGPGKIELGVEYRKDGDTPVIGYGPGTPPVIRHEENEQLIGVLRTTFTF